MPDNFPLNELQALLAQASAADPERKQSNAKYHNYQWNPPASLKKVQKFEEKIGISLPDDYRRFLLQAGDGGAGPYCGLFSLEQVEDWLTWPVDPEKTPCLRPGIRVQEMSASENWRQGCIPIGSEGDTYFTCLLVAGPDRGRVVYVEYEMSWIFFPREPDFLSWYTRWLREVAGGYHIYWFGTNLDGDEAALRAYYGQADTEEDRLLALGSMCKFPALSEDSCAFLRRIQEDWVAAGEVGELPELLYRADPAAYEQFLDKRWEAGKYGQVLYDLYHTPADQKALAARWRARILEKMPEAPTESYCIMLPLLKRGGGVTFEQASFLLDKTQGQEKYNLLIDLGHLPGAEDHLDFWLPILKEREDLELLRYALLSVPRTADPRLREALLQILKDFPYAAEQLYHVDRQDKEAWERSIRRTKERGLCENARYVLREVFYETINPALEGIPRPYRLEMTHHDKCDLGMDRTPPPDGIPIHPLIALAIQNLRSRLPSTAYDWARELRRTQSLSLQVIDQTVRTWDDENRRAVLRAPGGAFPAGPYYFSLGDWSAIGRMPKLWNLSIVGICVEDFSFLAQCQNVEVLSLYNTNFTDCRLLLAMPKLKRVDLRLCRLEHEEALEQLSAQCEW